MAKRTRNLAMATVAAAVLGMPVVSAAADALPGNQPVPGRHVRSSNSELIALIDRAGERSATFRSLVDTINASDSIVFVEPGKCGHGVRACFVSVTAVDSHRYMRVVVDTRKADWDLMGSIGHELRHTIEVIGQPSIRSNASKYFFYAQNGTEGTPTARETRAAVDAGNTVRDEVRRFTRQQPE
ncbi:MAG TPA: hypothetical protein VFU28_17765 [Vicinamibacterales bacterium]|nr:hypothetical protein [Vicinamibacterales bacterium]